MKIPKNSSADNSASATTSLAIVTTQFSAPDLIMVSVNAELASATMVGEATLVNAAALSTHAKLQMEKNVQDMELVVAVDASARSKKTSDIQENTARSVQHVRDVVTS